MTALIDQAFKFSSFKGRKTFSKSLGSNIFVCYVLYDSRKGHLLLKTCTIT